MRKQFRWHILAIILLCICLSFGLCDKNGHRNDRKTSAASRNDQNGKFRMPKQGIPLRDDSDYIRENEQHSTVDDDYDDEDGDDDEYFEGEATNDSTNNENGENNNNNNKNNENDVQQSPEIVEQAQSARTQIIQRPKELTDTEMDALLLPLTPNVDATAPATVSTELCPKECSCLDDFMTCTRPHLKHLPKVPQFIQSLYVLDALFFI